MAKKKPIIRSTTYEELFTDAPTPEDMLDAPPVHQIRPLPSEGKSRKILDELIGIMRQRAKEGKPMLFTIADPHGDGSGEEMKALIEDNDRLQKELEAEIAKPDTLPPGDKRD